MLKSYESFPLADPARERYASERFPMDESPELYAARNAHLWTCFGFDDYRYRSEMLTHWVHRLGDLLFQREGAPTIKQLRLEYLSPEEIKEIEQLEAEQQRRGEL